MKIQVGIETVCAMTGSIRTILKPFLIISCVFGLKIVTLSSHSKLWFNVMYILLVWSIYYFFSTFSSVLEAFNDNHPFEDSFCIGLEILTTFLSIIFGIYHEKKFQNCLKKFDIIDDTLFKLGIITDYNKLREKIIWFGLAWFIIVILTNCTTAYFIKNENDYNFVTAMTYIFLVNYCFHMNFIGDLITASILEYTGLKFDQTNEYLQHLIKNNKNKRKIKHDFENRKIYPHQHNFPKTLSNKSMLWIIVHLQLELRKIFREIDSIFGPQMTFRMASYFGWIVIDLREILYAILIINYVKFATPSVILHFMWLSHNIFKFMLINYMCETVTAKANATADLLNKLSYFTYDFEIHEIISQFSMRIIYAPLRFCGIGFFQFGYKFLYRFVMSIATVLVILIQARANK